MLNFPQGFLWGAATAAHQVEGSNTNNDWWEWEQKPGRIREGGSSAVACDWFRGERYREDFELARSLRMNAHRLSVEWSRLEPRKGEWDADAFSFYREVLAALRERGMTPLVTLHHFSNPCWLAEKGGWEDVDVVPVFERFANKVVEELGDLCEFWVTINEPVVYVYAGYVEGYWPPGKRDFVLGMRVLRNMLRGHAAAYHAIHRLQPTAQVGLAHNIHTFYAAQPNSLINRAVVGLQDYAYNQVVLKALEDGRLRLPLGRGQIATLAGTQDFFGLNSYFSTTVAVDWTRPTSMFGGKSQSQPWGLECDDILENWFGKGDVDPKALTVTLKDLTKYGKPIYITENGICDCNDELRPRFIVEHLAAIHQAIKEGADVRGYFYWTLVDNFEWVEGYTLKFGLIENDRQTQVRKPKPSAQIYGRIAESNGIPDDLVATFDGAPNG